MDKPMDMASIWMKMEEEGKALNFLTLTGLKKELVISLYCSKLGITLSAADRHAFISNQVYDDMLFWKWFEPIENPITPNNGDAFETYGKDLQYVEQMKELCPNNIWTELDADGLTVIVNGFHYVNRLRYFITKKSWEGPDVEFVDADQAVALLEEQAEDEDSEEESSDS